MSSIDTFFQESEELAGILKTHGWYLYPLIPTEGTPEIICDTAGPSTRYRIGGSYYFQPKTEVGENVREAADRVMKANGHVPAIDVYGDRHIFTRIEFNSEKAVLTIGTRPEPELTVPYEDGNLINLFETFFFTATPVRPSK